MFPGVFSVLNIKIIIFGSVCEVIENTYTAYFSNILFLIILDCVSSGQFFRVAPWQLSVRFYRFVPNDVWSKYDSVCNDLISASASDSAVMIRAVILSTAETIQQLQQLHQKTDVEHSTMARGVTHNWR
jgi:hypothetical protein